MNIQAISDEFERLVNSGGIRWLEYDKWKVHPGTAQYIAYFLDTAKVKYKMADVMMKDDEGGQHILLKLEGLESIGVHYFAGIGRDRGESSHMWGDEGFHNGLNGNMVLSHISGRITGANPAAIKSIYDSMDKAGGN